MSILSTVKAFFSDLKRAAGEHGADLYERPLIVGVSGGPDSVALLHVLAREGAYPGAQIVVAHLNHMLRPVAAAEAAFVASLVAGWQLPFRTAEVPVGTLAERQGLSLEATARQARYAFLAEVAREFGATHVATGHNQNDQAETVLMHLIRGSGLRGLGGMQAVSPVPGSPEVTLLRPLLAVTRKSIETYCSQNKLPYVEDESNVDVSLFRNRLRHELLPMLAGYNPRIMARLATLSRVAAADETLLAQILDAHWPALVTAHSITHLALDLSHWRALPLSMRRRSLRRAASLLRSDLSDVSFEATELAREVAEQGHTGDQATLPGRVTLTVGYDELVLATPEHQPADADWPQLVGEVVSRLAVPGAVQLAGGWLIRAERASEIDPEQIATNLDRWRAYVDAAFADDLIVRPRRAGERMRPLGMAGRSANIGDIMTNRKIPEGQRSRWPIVAGPEYALWLAGHVLDERARIQSGDREALLLRVEGPKSVD